MKENLFVQYLRLPAVAALTVLGAGCVDSERNLLDAEQLQTIYEETFPVKGVDPTGDWTLSQKISARVSVKGDAGTVYPIRIYDANPLNASAGAKLLAQGEASNENALALMMDCPAALERVFVARVDAHGRYLVQPTVVTNGAVTAHFGDRVANTRSATRAVETAIPTINAPYTADFIAAKKAIAAETQPGWDLGANAAWGYGDIPMFGEEDRWFKLPTGETDMALSLNGTSGGAKSVKLIVPAGCVWTVNKPTEFYSIGELIIENGGTLVIADGQTFKLSGGCYFTVLAGGTITGGGKLEMSNGSLENMEYNAGLIECSVLELNGGTFYNYGTLRLDTYTSATNVSGSVGLANHGTMEVDELNANNNTKLANACYLKSNTLKFGSLLLGHTSETICETLLSSGNNGDVEMEAQSMLVCTGEASMARNVTGPTTGAALIRLGKLANDLNWGNYSILNNVFCEVEGSKVEEGTPNWQWGALDWLVSYMQDGAAYCNPGKADFLLPADAECIKEGYGNDNTPDDVGTAPIVYSYAFEDNYPNAGDYDFNDIVLDVYMPAAANAVTELKYTIDLRAVGASVVLGAGLRIFGINKSDVQSVSFGEGAALRTASLDASTLFENAPYESAGSELVIPLFGNAHHIYGYADNRTMLNTGITSLPDVYSLEIIISLNKPMAVPSATEDLDFFIAHTQGAKKRMEIHLNRFGSIATAGGQLADPKVLDVIKAINNTWALCVPARFAYPKEGTLITKAYSQFAAWAQAQDTNLDWYLTPADESLIIRN
ncbi:MAG: LruC domain-containing protein [Mediterranea sp.]|jgi:LruC domain-containing protein|nr:LruC domain-containing protein [Mediterranea sp.]